MSCSASASASASASSSFFEELLWNKDILDNVTFNWLGTKDLVSFDNAVVGEQRRAQFHEALAGVRYRVPFEKNLEMWWKNHKNILHWFIARQMYNSEGVWHVNQKLWETLINDPKYDTMLSTMRGIRFENFSGEASLTGLEKCTNLHRLEVCNLLQPKAGETPLVLPNLRELYLQNCQMDANLLSLFSNLPAMKILQLHHVRYQQVPADLAQAFIGEVETLKILGGLDDFLAFIVQKPTKLQVVTIDKMHKADTNPQDLHDFLKNVPEVRELYVDRMRIHMPSFFKCLSSYNRSLKRLHLNHIRLMDVATPAPEVAIDLTFTSLQISTLLQSTNQEVLKILDFCKNTLSELQLSFCSKLDNAGFAEIARTLNALNSIEIDDKKELFEGSANAGRVAIVANDFAHVNKVKISLWPEWKSEKEKEMVPEQREVVFEK